MTTYLLKKYLCFFFAGQFLTCLSYGQCSFTVRAGNNGPLCTQDTLYLTATSIAGATYSWTGPMGYTSNLQNPVLTYTPISQTGIYTVTATLNGCSVSDTTNVVLIPAVVTPPNAWYRGPACIGRDLYLFADNYTDGIYTWTGPNGFTGTTSAPVISNATLSNAGTYTVTVSVNGCSSKPGTTTVVIQPTPNAPGAGSNSPLCENETLNLTAGNIPLATYNWNGPNSFTSTNQNPSITNVQQNNDGTYSVTATVDGCISDPSIVIVDVKPLPPQPSINNNGPLCVGATLNLSASDIVNGIYSWTGPNSFSSNIQNPSITNVSPVNAGVYTVTPIINGCTGASASTTVIVNPIPPAPVAANNGPLCLGETLNLSANFVAGATYKWTGPNGFTSTLQNPVISNITVSNAGKYYVSISVNGCNGPQDSTTLTLKTTPGTPVATNNGPLCIGSTLNLSVGTVTGATYIWNGPNGFTSTLQNPVINNVGIINGGNYSVSSVINGCPSLPTVTTVVIIPTPATPVAGSNSPLCVGGILNLTSNTIPGASYSWSGSNGFTSFLQNPTINNISLQNAGIYSVTVTVNGCISAAGTTSIIINPIPAAPMLQNNSPLCQGTTINLIANSVAGASYSWSGPAGFTSLMQNPVINNATLANAGIYNATITVNGCTSSAGNTSVIVNPSPPKPAAANNGILCTGDALNLSVTGVPGATYTWTGPNGFTSNLQNPVINNVLLSDAGIYTVAATVNGCTGIADSTNVVIKVMPPTPIINNNSPVCSGDTLFLTTPSIQGVLYSWSGPNGFISSSQNPSLPNITMADAGIYSLTLAGCISKTNTANVVVKPTPIVPVATNNGPLCEGNTLNLTTPALPGANYKWRGPNNFSSTQQNPVVMNVLPVDEGTYYLAVTDNGCSSPEGNTMVNVNRRVIANAGMDQIVCADNNNVNVAGIVTGGSNTGIWSSNGTGSFSPSSSSLIAIYSLTNADKAAGNVTLTLTSTNNGGCPVSVSSLLVTIPQQITVNAGLDQTVCASTPQIILGGQVNGATGGIWSSTGDGIFMPSNTSLSAFYSPGAMDKSKGNTTIILKSTGNGNCTPVNDSLKLFILPGPIVNAGADEYVIENATITLNPEVTGSMLNFLWTPNSNLSSDTVKNPVLTGIKDQIYTLTVTDSAGCFNKDNVFVKVLKLPVIPNTFTPNSDGINDLWIIKNLEDYPDCKVSVFNRYGQILFNSTGYTKPWDGMYKQKPLPLGTYYYIIEPGNGVSPITGYVTILK